jgi:transcriptional regulator with XRE-family HTH domain
MPTRPRQRPRDLRLKIAILESGLTQRRLAILLRLSELRLSELVNQRGAPATASEKTRLAKHLGRPIADLFPPDDQWEAAS